MLDPLTDPIVAPATYAAAHTGDGGEAPDLRALPADQRTNLMAGDLVSVNQPSVNGRAWMSRIAPVKRSLKRGNQAELLSDPIRSEGSIWVKLRLIDDASDEEFFVAARYLDLVEARSDVPLSVEWPVTIDDATSEGFCPGDLVYTAVKVNLRAAPGKQNPLLRELAPDMVLSVIPTTDGDDRAGWLRVAHAGQDGWAASTHLRLFARVQKWIEVDLAAQTLIAWNAGEAEQRLTISSGKPGFRTPTGVFSITAKLPTRRAMGYLNGEQWDIPGVPWVMIFRHGGFYFHGVYWHDDFGTPASHGCVTLSVPDAEQLYEWTPSGTPVWIHP